MLIFFLKKDEDTTSSIWGDAPDKFGKWNCRCFVGILKDKCKISQQLLMI